ncbi:IS66 family transposase zinc-finger binding domain-containing protein [Methylobacterium sp. J-026]|uniref:IS66 family transposase zinc-finger binding domain-containing protein n=1 Tax=Methylobacterium sp. J-026 TaxID=2836624 RepID=UPI001FB9881F|nr:IS66 family transposase zinc-finger binding domain-containing protein [Methylobacterium sp. J-026]MCJ2136014.1 IS66 family transposase zinc-finger binding domain-containing protein [Methylobacterium sp. J-026]
MAREAVHANSPIEELRSEPARHKRVQFGVSSEKLKARVEHPELATEPSEVDAASRARPARGPLPDHLSRESVIYPGPCACPSCRGVLRRIGEDVRKTLDCVPSRFKRVRHVREAFACQL